MSKNFPVNPLEAVAERKLCNEKISTVSLYWCDSRRNFSYAAIARAQIAFIAVQPLNDLGLALCIFDESGRCAFASSHTPFESELSAGVIAVGSQQVSLWFRACLPPGRYALSFSLAERSGLSDDLADWKVLCQQMHYLPFTIFEGGSPPPPLGYAQIQTCSTLVSRTVVESPPENEALDHFPWSPGQYTLSDILATLDVTLPERIAAKARVELPGTLDTQQLPLRLPANHARFHTVVGRRSNLGVSTTGKAGVLLYGPYIPAEPGVYVSIFDISSRSANDDQVVVLDVVADKGKLCLGKTEWRARTQQPAKIIFEVPDLGVSNLEFRAFVNPQGNYEIRSITVLSPQQESLWQALVQASPLSLLQKQQPSVLLHLAPPNTKGLPLLRVSDRGESSSSEAAYRQLLPMLSKDAIVAVENTNGIKSPVFYLAGEQRPVYLILFMPENHYVWTEVLLALANQLWEKEGGVSIFVTPDSGKLPRFDGSPAVHSTITLDDLIATHEGFEFSRMYVHGFGYPKFRERLRQSFPKTPYGLYGDGFKNGIFSFQEAEEIVFWGWSPVSSLCPQRIVTDQYFHRALAQLSKDFELPKTVLSADVMLCLRYYGMGPYQMGTDQICELIWETICPVLRPGDVLIVKADARAPNLTQTVIAFLAQRHEGEVRDFASDVGDWAAKPLELLFATDCLTKIRDFVVFDSSLCWLLLHTPKLRHDLRVVFGANLVSLSSAVISDKKINQIIQTIRDCTYLYAIALQRDGVKVNRLADACYVASNLEYEVTDYPAPAIPEKPSSSPEARNEEAWLRRHQAIFVHSENQSPNILWLGDSLSQGLENHPDLLKQYLPYSILNAGFSGDRTEHLLWRLKDGEGKDLSPAVVLVWIGTNDIGQIQPTPPAEQVFCNIRAVCREVEARFPKAQKVLMALLPRDVSAVHPFRRVIKEVNALLNTYAQEQGWHFMDEGERFVDEAEHLRMD